MDLQGILFLLNQAGVALMQANAQIQELEQENHALKHQQQNSADN